MKVLFVADICGEVGLQMAEKYITRLRKEYQLDFVVANGENAAPKNGINEKAFRRLLLAGVDCVTLGNHSFDCAEVLDFIERSEELIRPYNYPPQTPGKGWCLLEKGAERLAVASLMGNVFVSNLPSPFAVVDALLAEIKDSSGGENILIDIHAEATSEKIALAYYLDGRVSAVIGTHTHVQTADEKILTKGSAYLTDCGMCGAYESVLGVDAALAIERFQTQRPVRFAQAKGKGQFNGCIIEIKKGKATDIKRINIVEK